MSVTTSNPAPQHAQGLEGVVACESAICTVDGQAGILTYHGYDIHDLADHASFEEVVYLLWFGVLPTRAELDDLTGQVAAARALPVEIMAMLHTFPKDAVPMIVLRTIVSALGIYDTEAADKSEAANRRKAARLLARIPTAVAAYDRLRRGLEPAAPTDHPSVAMDFLSQLHGTAPSETQRKALDIAFILQAEHELNASTFAARVTAATLADFYAAMTVAVATLAGPLHGGANEDSMKMLATLHSPAEATRYVEATLAAHGKVSGFGHRVYKGEDPRATHLREMARQVLVESGAENTFATMHAMEEAMLTGKNLHANVDFYSGPVYQALGITADLFTPVFAIARTSGWSAHILEQYANNRIMRPRADYIGEHGLRYVPLDART